MNKEKKYGKFLFFLVAFSVISTLVCSLEMLPGTNEPIEIIRVPLWATIPLFAIIFFPLFKRRRNRWR